MLEKIKYLNEFRLMVSGFRNRILKLLLNIFITQFSINHQKSQNNGMEIKYS